MGMASLALFACKPTVPSQYIQPSDMEDLLYDYHISQAMAELAGGNESYHQTLYFAAALEKHGVTRAQFDSSLTYYYIRADRLSEMYKHIAKRLSEDALDLGASEGEVNRYANLSGNGDTINIWAGQLSAMLIPYAPYNRIDFVQKADTSFRNGDSFMLVLNNEFLYQAGMRNAEACITIKYDNDTVVSRAVSVSSSGVSNIRVPECKNRKAKEIKGFIYLVPEREATNTLKLMIIKDIQLIKFRKPKEELPKDSIGKKDLKPITKNEVL